MLRNVLRAAPVQRPSRAWSASLRVALIGAVLAGGVSAIAAVQARAAASTISWNDVAPLQPALRARGIDAEGFAAYVERVRQENIRRVRAGDLDALVFYLLQSSRFTDLPRIEPALSAKALVESLPARERLAFLESGAIAASHIPEPVRARAAALVRAFDEHDDDPRVAYFREVMTAAVPDADRREAALLDEYLRVMRFVYRQEFVAGRGADAPGAVRELYQRRGFSTDTAVEAGFLVHSGLGIVKALEPDRRIRRVLIVGPGMDLAPRTGLVETGPPESYQPWAVIDALLALDLAREDALEVVAADINPRVVAHLQRSRTAPPALTLVTGLQENGTVSFSDDYRDYFTRLGQAIGGADTQATVPERVDGHLRKQIRVRPEAARALRADRLDIVTERLDGQVFDLVIATNILPYFDDTELMLATTNIARMLAPGGVFLHNEGRPILGEITEALGLPFEQARHTVIAHVRGARAPLGDSAWLHRKKGSGDR